MIQYFVKYINHELHNIERCINICKYNYLTIFTDPLWLEKQLNTRIKILDLKNLEN